jgi:hypothetical protein
MTKDLKPLREMPNEELEAELLRRKQEQYPADVRELALAVKALADRHGRKPRKVLDDVNNRFQKYSQELIADSAAT